MTAIPQQAATASPELPLAQIIAADFQTAARVVLSFLQERLGFGLWMVTRTSGEDWIVLASEDRRYGVVDGDVFRWSDSFCSRMVQGFGPRIAPNSDNVPAYAAAPIGRQVEIKAYVGVPIAAADGAVFGTLCAIDPEPKPEAIVKEQQLVELLAGLLGNILSREREKDAERRSAERARVEARKDALTGLFNRRGWDEMLELEEARCRRYGDPAAIIVVDLDHLKRINDDKGHATGDELLVRAARTLEALSRQSDLVARMGGDEFGLLAVRCNAQDAAALAKRVEAALAAIGIEASVGFATRHPSRGLQAAQLQADERMYRRKRARKDTGTTSPTLTQSSPDAPPLANECAAPRPKPALVSRLDSHDRRTA